MCNATTNAVRIISVQVTLPWSGERATILAELWEWNPNIASSCRLATYRHPYGKIERVESLPLFNANDGAGWIVSHSQRFSQRSKRRAAYTGWASDEIQARADEAVAANRAKAKADRELAAKAFRMSREGEGPSTIAIELGLRDRAGRTDTRAADRLIDEGRRLAASSAAKAPAPAAPAAPAADGEERSKCCGATMTLHDDGAPLCRHCHGPFEAAASTKGGAA